MILISSRVRSYLYRNEQLYKWACCNYSNNKRIDDVWSSCHLLGLEIDIEVDMLGRIEAMF